MANPYQSPICSQEDETPRISLIALIGITVGAMLLAVAMILSIHVAYLYLSEPVLTGEEPRNAKNYSVELTVAFNGMAAMACGFLALPILSVSLGFHRLTFGDVSKRRREY